MTTPATAAELEKALEAEWGTYVALGPIHIGNARAFNRGHAVPVSHVENGLVPVDMVAKVTTKAGREALGITDDQKG